MIGAGGDLVSIYGRVPYEAGKRGPMCYARTAYPKKVLTHALELNESVRKLYKTALEHSLGV